MSKALLSRPNIVIILADDMGFSDVGCYGGEIHTKNIDRLAHDGVRFTQFYNMARCCPTRAALMTGLYPHEAGMGEMNQDLGSEPYQGELNDRCATIAEVLKPQGYHTGMVGKWHLVHLNIATASPAQQKAMINHKIDAPISPSKKDWPSNRGFEDYWGTIPGVESYWDPYGLVHNEESIERDKPGFYYTDFITRKSVSMIDQFSQDKSKPFFMYVAYTAPHWPMQAPQKDVDRYKSTYMEGWDAIRKERYERQLKLGIIDPQWKLSPRQSDQNFADRDSTVTPWADDKNKTWEASRMATYAAMVENLDRGIGSIMAELKKSGADKNTIVFFLSDNGGCQENVQPSWYDIPSETRDGRTIHVGNDARYLPGGDETVYQSYGPMWANVSNTPFRMYKHYTEEGGVSTPFIVRWPSGGLQSGKIEKSAIGNVIDLMPTILELAGAKYPEKMNGNVLRKLDGVSLLPALKGQSFERGCLFWEHEGNRAAQKGRWKIVAPARKSWKLFDLQADRTELNDVSDKFPQIKAELVSAFKEWAGRVGARN